MALRSSAIVAALALATCSLAEAQTTTRVSVASNGHQGNAASTQVDMTPDGRFVVFFSGATNLTPESLPGIFQHDRVTGATTLVVRTVAGFGSMFPSVSDDGRYVAFLSAVDNLVPGDTNGSIDAFVWDSVSRAYQRVNLYFGQLFVPNDLAISGDGRYVAMGTSFGTSTGRRIIVFDRVLQQSIDPGTAAADARDPRLGADGRFVAYTAFADSAPGDSNGASDVYLHDRNTATTTRVSTSGAGAQGNAASTLLDMSADGRWFLFSSVATNFFPGDAGVTADLFLKDRQTGVLTRINLDFNGQRAEFFHGLGIQRPALSADGRWVVFASPTRILAEDRNALPDTYLFDRDTAAMLRVSKATDGGEAHGGASASGIASSDGRYISFTSFAHNLVPGDTNFDEDVFLLDTGTPPPCSVAIAPNALTVVSNNGGGGTLTITAPPSCAWTATVNAHWIHLTSPPSGVGNGAVSYTFEPYFSFSTIRSGAVVVNTQGFGMRQLPMNTAPPLAVWELPFAQTTDNVTGAIPLGGWAVDDVGISRIRIFRDPVTGEGPNQIYLGDGVRVPGARPDVEWANPWYPENTSAGWGFMLLTNMLPNQGNGSFALYVYFDDRDGHTVVRGPKTITATNATANLPFGTIDTPAQGEVVSGTVVNFGWVLTPQPKIIPTDGSTITVFIDGVPVGQPSYNHFRSDIATLFPGYQNSNGAVGFFVFDSTAYANGPHTIAWAVTDSMGVTTGIGSRFFWIEN